MDPETPKQKDPEAQAWIAWVGVIIVPFRGAVIVWLGEAMRRLGKLYVGPSISPPRERTRSFVVTILYFHFGQRERILNR